MEARLLMMRPNKHFQPVIRQADYHTDADITLGCYYLTAEPRTPMARRHAESAVFGSKDEVIFAYGRRRVEDPRPDSSGESRFRPANRLWRQRPRRSSKQLSAASPSARFGRRNSAFTTRPRQEPARRFDLEVLQVRRPRPKPSRCRQAQGTGLPRGHEIRASIGIDDMIVPRKRTRK